MTLSSLVHCFKTFSHFPHKIKQTVWVLSCYTSHALYIPSHILSCHLILNTLNYPNQEGCRPLDSTCQLHLFSRLIFFTLQLSPSLNAECWLIFFFNNILVNYFTKRKRYYRLHNLLTCNLLLKSKSLYSHFSLELIL